MSLLTKKTSFWHEFAMHGCDEEKTYFYFFLFVLNF